MREDRLSAAMRRQVAKRAYGCCEYCRSQERFAMQPFSAEHIIPRSRKGATRMDNLAWSCQGCNNHKYNKGSARDPITGAIVTLFHPRNQHWDDHFVWNEECMHILGRTPTGRATVAALRLNRMGLVNLRRVLVAVQEHPPSFA